MAQGATTDARPGYGASPIHVFRRTDVAKVRITVRADEPTITFSIAHIDLYFFYDIDVAILVVEIHGEDMTLAQVHDTMFRFGRVYPTFWNTDGSAGHCCHLTEWIARDGTWRRPGRTSSARTSISPPSAATAPPTSVAIGPSC